LIFLLATVPARFALQYLPADLPLRISGASGTIWHGRAEQAVWQKQAIGQIQWKLSPLPLLLGKVKANVKIDGDGIEAHGLVTATRNQTVILTNTEINADLTRIPLPQKLMATPGGKAHALIHHARIENRWPTELDADITWQPAELLSPFEVKIGKATLNVGSSNNTLNGDLQSEGALETKGKLSLSRNGAFSANVKIAPTEQTPRELRDMLPMLGRPDSKGAVTLRQSLQLRGFPP
jgi:general secretion pathway protein N